MKSRLEQGPLSIAVEAGSKCFQWYESGVLDSETAKEFGCGDWIDHGVVLVGIHYAGDEGNAAGDDNNDGDGDDDTEYEEVCRRAKRKERKQK